MNKHILITLSFLITLAGTGHAETTQCQSIGALPFTISKSGIYCMKKNSAFTKNGTPISTGSAISILADDVILDLNGHVLAGDAAGAGTQANGIVVGTQNNVTIKNGTVRGFEVGVYFSGTGENNVVEDIVADGSTLTGISMNSTFGIVRNNRVTNTGGTSLNVNAAAYGICAPGDHTRILNNSVSGVASQGTGMAFGIGCLVAAPNHQVVQDKMISDVNSTASGVGIGIYFYGGADNVAVGNRIMDTGAGIDFDNSGTGAYMNNLVINANPAYAAGGTAAGSTNY